MGNKQKRRNIVYSTDPDFRHEHENRPDQETLPPQQQTLYVSLDRKGRKGKSATLIKGFVGSEADLQVLGRRLKTACGSGGTVKEGIILIQGDFRDKIEVMLIKQGYKTKRSGG